MTTRMVQRRGLAAEWASVNPVLAAGEIGFELDTGLIKIGDGVTEWNDITSPYQLSDSDINTIAALDSSTAGAIASDGAGWIKKTYAQFKTALGLDQVNNTSDADKPISTAQQTALDAKANVSALATKADLVGGLIPTSQLPAITTGQTVTVASQAAMLALTSTQVQPGDIAIRSDQSGHRWLLAALDPSILANWIALEVPDGVSSVNGLTGAVVLNPGNVGAQPSDTDLTSIAALDSSTAGTIASDGAGWIKKTYAQFKTALVLVKADVGLANVDNTTDAGKPVSTAQAAALVAKTGDTMTGALTVPDLIVSGMTGATAASRYVGATASGAPTSGTFAKGDFIIDQTAAIWICTVSGSPGTWVKAGGAGGGGGATFAVEYDDNSIGSSAFGGSSFTSTTNWTFVPTTVTIVCGASGIIALTYELLGRNASQSAYIAAVTPAQSANDAVSAYQSNGGGVSLINQAAGVVNDVGVEFTGIRVVTGLIPGTSYTFGLYGVATVFGAVKYQGRITGSATSQVSCFSAITAMTN